MKNPGYLEYEKNKDGFYDVIFMTDEICLMNADYVGNSYTRYRMKNGKLAIVEQWYKGTAD